MNGEFKNVIKTVATVIKRISLKHKLSLSSALVIMFITGALSNIPAVSLGKLVDNMFNKTVASLSDALPFLVAIACAILIKEALTVLRKYLVENTCCFIEKEKMIELIAHLLKLKMSFFAEIRSGSLNGRIARSIEGLIKIIKLLFIDFFPVLFSALFSLAIALSKNLYLGMAMAAVIPIGIVIVILQVSSQKWIRLDLLRSKEEIDGTFVEILGGLEVVRVSNTWEHETQKVDKIAEKLRKIEIRHHITMSIFDAWKYLNEGLFLIIVISFSIYLATKQIISYGDILTYAMLFSSIINPLREIHRILDEAHEATLRVADLFTLFDIDEDTSFEVKNNKINVNFKDSQYAISIDKLEFKYSEQQSKPVINNVDCKIKIGERIGIVGKSGCGKSSFLKMILKLYRNTGGKIHIAGLDIEDISREDISNHFAYVSQTPFVFSGTIADNIRYNNPYASLEEIIEVARMANLHEEIMKMERGYDSWVTERGSNLSGGQRQRIAIARALLCNPDILILDEATSALDNLNETYILGNIEKELKGKTIIMVAHRLTTLRNTDRILVFNEGELVEEGSYEMLSSNHNTLFSKLEKFN